MQEEEDAVQGSRLLEAGRESLDEVCQGVVGDSAAGAGVGMNDGYRLNPSLLLSLGQKATQCADATRAFQHIVPFVKRTLAEVFQRRPARSETARLLYH